jgi:hypothetical protein
MRGLISVSVAVLGALVGFGLAVAIAYSLLSGEGADLLSWTITADLLAVPLGLGGAVAAGILCRRLFPRSFVPEHQTTPAGWDRYVVGDSVFFGISGILTAGVLVFAVFLLVVI